MSRLDVGNGEGCADATIARYRLSVGGTALALSADDVPPGAWSVGETVRPRRARGLYAPCPC